jgi:hypothetical protein
MEINVATMFSREYIVQGLTMLNSFLRNNPNAKVWILALDVKTLTVISQVQPKSTHTILISKENELYQRFLYFQRSRSFAESIFSIKPHWVHYVLNKIRDEDIVLYIDADSYFFMELPNLGLFKEASLILSPHYFPKNSDASAEVGRYNAGFVGFKKNNIGVKAVNLWCDLCNNWCFAYKSDGKFADQKYLDQISTNFINSVSETPFGINLGLWSFSSDTRVKIEKSGFQVGENKLISFHFHSIRLSRNFIFMDLHRYQRLACSRELYEKIYSPYVDDLKSVQETLKNKGFESKMFENIIIPRGLTFKNFMKLLLQGQIKLMR